MSFLLDTHVVLFACVEPDRIPPTVRREIVAGRAQLFVSAISWYEVALKANKGALPASIAPAFTNMIRSLRATPINVTHDHAAGAGGLPLAAGDPFDRIIAAQALAEGLTGISADPAMDVLGARRFRG